MFRWNPTNRKKKGIQDMVALNNYKKWRRKTFPITYGSIGAKSKMTQETK
jgi:hypothetical protein